MSMTIFTMIHEDYLLTRQFVESILNNVNPKSYDKILIIDDYSNPKGKLRKYLEYLKTQPKFEIVTFNEKRRINFYSQDNGSKPNLGHAVCMNIAIDLIKTDYMIYLDADCIFLTKSYDMLTRIEKIFDSNPNVMGVGQLFGVNDPEERIVDYRFNFFMKNKNRSTTAGGFLGPSSGACRMSAWRENKLKRFPETKLGYFFNRYCMDLFENNFNTYSYPWFTNREIIHLGNGVIRRIVGGEKSNFFVFCKDFKGPYGTRISENEIAGHHYGRHFLKLTSKQLWKMLEDKYYNAFDERQESIDEALIYAVD